MKFVVAPESTKASVCTFLPYTQSVTGMRNELFLLRAILFTQDSSTTSLESGSALTAGTLLPDCRSQTVSSTVPRENPVELDVTSLILFDPSVVMVPTAVH